MQVNEFFDAVENRKQSFLLRNGLADSESAKRKKKGTQTPQKARARAKKRNADRQTDSQPASRDSRLRGIHIPWSTSRGSQVLKWHPQMSLGTCVAVTCPHSPLSFPNMSPGKFSGKVVFFVGEMNKCLIVCLFCGLVLFWWCNCGGDHPISLI